MRIEQLEWTADRWRSLNGARLGSEADLVLMFGGRSALESRSPIDTLRDLFPRARRLGCSTAGEILDTTVRDDSLSATAVQFERTEVRAARVSLRGDDDSFAAGRRLAERLEPDGLAHVLMLSTGLNVNGSDLVRGVTSQLPAEVTVTGGLSGDGERFERTLVMWDDRAEPDAVVALGLYGDRLRVGYGSLGGWDPFGPNRLITRSAGNVLYELDGRPALDLYKLYLGEHASGLPATGLLFPLSLTMHDRDTPLVRTIVSVDEGDGSMTFAGDVPEGTLARLMKANFDRLIDGAAAAARTSHVALTGSDPELAILISCVGRKLILKQRVEEEVEAVREVLGARPALAGFYSYGEISPFVPHARCELHNQTMTITTLTEA